MANCCSNFALSSLLINQSSFPGDGCFFAISSGSRGERGERGGGGGEGRNFLPPSFMFHCRRRRRRNNRLPFLLLPSPSSSSSSSSTQPRHLFHFHRFSHSQRMTERKGGLKGPNAGRGYHCETVGTPTLRRGPFHRQRCRLTSSA